MTTNLPATQDETAVAPAEVQPQPPLAVDRPVGVALLPLALAAFVILAFVMAAWTFAATAF